MLAGPVTAHAHVPYIERDDYTVGEPFVVRRVEHSIAVYAWLETGSDVDTYRFEVRGPVRVFVQALVPVCPAYDRFLPSFAVIGPGLPEPTEPLPVSVPEGQGAVVVPNVATDEPREVFYEPFGAKNYYDGPVFDQIVDGQGIWQIVFWDPYGQGGDYVAVVGKQERFSLRDILRSLLNTRLIRRGNELHVDC
jgi:hypothetical protein